MNYYEKKVAEMLDVSPFGNKDCKGIPKHVAFLFSGRELLQVQTNARYLHHAEEAIMKTRNSWYTRKKLRIYVTKVGGAHKMSRPCWYCSMQMKKIPSIRVFYTCKDGTWQEDTNLDNVHLSMRDMGRNRNCITRITPPKKILDAHR